MTAILATALIFLGCSDQSESKASESNLESNKAGTGQNASSAGGETIKGTVLETFDSGGYTYIKLDTTGEGEIWVATVNLDLQKGKNIELMSGPVMHDFYSKTLDRTFPEIIFSGGLKGSESGPGKGHQMTGMMNSYGQQPAGRGQEEPSFQDALKSEGMGPMSMPTESGRPQTESGGSLKAVTTAQDISVQKSSAENGYTIAEIYSKAGELDGKKVQVRGKVMKVSPNIMGKNWIHFQDGTGNAMKNTHDLVFTSQARPEKGQKLVMEGTLAKEKDFGAGYRYKAIVENAEIVE
ncbi:MAG: DNA-binding protein [Thermodesulfobacteriota bacterium]